ncbi:hypothetical protein FPV67DRAFT_1673023 [Lyophyllum atratum]|nr:hypothetical protein FPV67DRAFT_1673023 [Lyophyllum atratum]
MKFNLFALAVLIGQVAVIAPAVGAPVEQVDGLVALLNRQVVGRPLAATHGSGGARKDPDSAGLGSGGATASRPAAGPGSGGATGVVEMLLKPRNCLAEILMK